MGLLTGGTKSGQKIYYYNLYYDLYDDFSNYANNAWVSAFGKNLNTDNLIFMSFSDVISYSQATDITFYLIEANNTNTNSLDYLSIDYYSINSEWGILGYKLKFCSSSGSQIGLSDSNNKILAITIDTSLNFSHTVIKPDDNFYNITDNQIYLFNSYNNSDTAVFCPYNFCSLKNFVIYSDIGIGKNVDNNNFKPLILKSFNDSSDTGGEGGEGGDDTGGGSTTTPDYSEDLENIQGSIDDVNTSINNQGQAIIENQNQNTEQIKQEIGNVNENLTTVPDLEDKEVTGEDIINNFNFEFMEDPYSNFWFELITGVGSCLTDNVRTFNINWLGYEYTFNLDNWGSFYPSAIEFILSSISTVAIVWVIVKWWKIIIDNLTSGSIDQVLAMNEEEGIIDLF